MKALLFTTFSLLLASALQALEVPTVLDGELNTGSHQTAIALNLGKVAPKERFSILIVRTPGPESEINASITVVTDTSVSFVFKDFNGNTGKGTLKASGRDTYTIDLEPLKLIEPRTAALLGTYQLKKPKTKE